MFDAAPVGQTEPSSPTSLSPVETEDSDPRLELQISQPQCHLGRIHGGANFPLQRILRSLSEIVLPRSTVLPLNDADPRNIAIDQSQLEEDSGPEVLPCTVD